MRTNRGINEKKKKTSLLHLAWYVQWRGETNSRERKSNLSLDFSAIGPSVSNEARSKVALRGKGYAWAPVLGSFDKIREVGFFSYLVYFRFKSFVNGLVYKWSFGQSQNLGLKC